MLLNEMEDIMHGQMYNGYGCCMEHVIPLELNAMDQLKFMFVSILFCFYIYFDFKPIVFDQSNINDMDDDE